MKWSSSGVGQVMLPAAHPGTRAEKRVKGQEDA